MRQNIVFFTNGISKNTQKASKNIWKMDNFVFRKPKKNQAFVKFTIKFLKKRKKRPKKHGASFTLPLFSIFIDKKPKF